MVTYADVYRLYTVHLYTHYIAYELFQTLPKGGTNTSCSFVPTGCEWLLRIINYNLSHTYVYIIYAILRMVINKILIALGLKPFGSHIQWWTIQFSVACFWANIFKKAKPNLNGPRYWHILTIWSDMAQHVSCFHQKQWWLSWVYYIIQYID